METQQIKQVMAVMQLRFTNTFISIATHKPDLTFTEYMFTGVFCWKSGHI